MSMIERLPPGKVLARVPFEDCLVARPRRPLPADLARWAAGLPVPPRLAALGLATPLRDTVAPLWAAVLARFRQGLRIEASERGRVIVHCDTVRYELTPSGEVHARIPRHGGGYDTIAVEVGTPFPSWRWVRALAMREPEPVGPMLAAIHARRLTGMAPAETLPGGLELEALVWLAGVVEGLARRCVDGLRMRAHLRAALDVDPILLDAARRSRPRRFAGSDVDNGWWNACIGQRETLLEVRAHAPGLLPLCGELVDHGEASPRVRNVAWLRWNINPALTPGDWRRVARCAPRPLWRMFGDRRIRSLESLKLFLADWARVHVGLPVGMRMPLPLFDALARTHTGPLADHVLPPVRWPGTPAATRQAIEAYRAACARGEGRRFIEEEWAPVVRWAGDYCGPGRQPVRHWSTMRRLAAEDERRLRAQSSGCEWPTPLASFEHGPFRAVSLCTSDALVEEAITMRHCADRFMLHCSVGTLAIYGVRDRATGRRLATVSLALRGAEASVQEVSRSLNRRPGTAELDFAGRLARAVGDALKARDAARARRELPIPPAASKALYVERKDSDVYAYVEWTPTGWKGYKVAPCGTVKEISGAEAIEPLNPSSWSPMDREDFISAVTALRTLRQEGDGPQDTLVSNSPAA